MLGKLEPMTPWSAARAWPCVACTLLSKIDTACHPADPSSWWWLMGNNGRVQICEGCAQRLVREGAAEGPAD